MARAARKSAKPRKTPIALPGVSSRPAWQGVLRLSLVTCDVALFRATAAGSDVSFHMINPDTGNRIKMVPTDPDTGPVERGDLVKGYEVEKDNYILFSDEELASVKLETTRTLNIESFVDADSIDRLYLDEPYILAPADAGAAEAYAVIQQAMVSANKIALGRLTMHTRERLVGIEPRDNGLLATTLRTRDEVVNTADALSTIPRGKADKQMIEIARQIITQQAGDFDPEQFTDRYEDSLRDLIEQKRKGHKIKAPAPQKESNVVDLMDALKRSLGKRAPGKAAATTKTAPAKRKPQKRVAGRK